ncbi:hypothetical protein CCHL11_04523 [Colletotrichum chlorophyti]|uniref:Uncharacterized protein n=1 Tax=Colletotrichum chlorophyti TaxID=708187 RepID=A0A1Q8RRJ9_9PEZI|nr:hypothetical protein CCHL11_04523 [Colletotrichum chlorophyti]
MYPHVTDKEQVLISFVVSPALSRIRSRYILVFGLACGATTPFIIVIPAIPPETSYRAYGSPAMSCSWPPDCPPPTPGSGLLQSSSKVGCVLGLAIATVVQTSAQGFGEGGTGFAGSTGFLYGVRAT